MSRKCDECHRQKDRHLWLATEWKKKGPALCKSCYKKSDRYLNQLNTTYLRKYGITLEEYDMLLEGQEGRCWVCGNKPAGQRLAVDHDHGVKNLRKSVRGLLCRSCNEYIGHIRDSRSAAYRLYLYLDLFHRPAQKILV